MHVNNRILANLSSEKRAAVNEILLHHPAFVEKHLTILSRMTVKCIYATGKALDAGVCDRDIIKIVRVQSSCNDNMAIHIGLLACGLKDLAFSCPEKRGIYKTGEVPELYHCSVCGVHGVKLWRLYFSQQMLFCACCAEKIQSPRKSIEFEECGDAERPEDTLLDPWVVDENGRIPSDIFIEDKTCQLEVVVYGTLVPAILTEEADNFYGYSSVPQHGCDWYYKLPTRLK